MLKIKDNECSYSVYKHTFPNSKVYIGITFRNPLVRWGNGNNYSNNQYMTNAIKKYGWNNIKHEILFSNLTKEKAEKLEIELIALYKSSKPKYGYNITNGGKHNGMFSEQTIEKMRKAQLGKHLSKETKNKISKSNKGKYVSKETIEKIKKTKKDKGCSELSRFKCKLNGIKNGINNIKNAWTKTSKKVSKYDKENILLETYESISDASRKTGITITSISYVCNNKRKTAGGYIWHFV